MYDRVEIKQPIASIWGSFGFVAVFIQNQAPRNASELRCAANRCVSVAQGFILFGIRLKARLPVQTRLLKLTLDQSRSRVCPGESLHREALINFAPRTRQRVSRLHRCSGGPPAHSWQCVSV